MNANICQNCGWENHKQAQVCARCSTVLPVHCPGCNQLVPVGNNFCGHCGTQITLERAPAAQVSSEEKSPTKSIELMISKLRGKASANIADRFHAEAREALGQRREISVMFVDVANFTAASRQLGSEEIFIMMNELVDRMVNVIYRYEGTVDKFTGDGLIALFGIPFNHENDPERAVRVALEIHQAVSPLRSLLKSQYDLDLGIRIGINTGVVIVGNLGSELHMEYTVIGDTVNLASRLESQADPGSTLISSQTYKRVRRLFTFEIVPPLLLKGYNQPVQVYKPIGLRKGTPRLRGGEGFRVPMVGRQDQLRIMADALEYVQREKSSRLITIFGEAGSGKTRLIEEFQKSMEGSGVRFHYSSCGTFMRITPYHVIRKLLRSVMHISDTDPIKDQLEAVQEHLRFLSLEETEILPYLLYVLEIPQTSALYDSQLKILDATVLQKQTHASLRKIFTASAELFTTVFVLDDLHWVDQASKEFLEFFCQAVDRYPILIILSSRSFQPSPDLNPQVIDTYRTLDRFNAIEIQPLTEEEGVLLINKIIKQADPAFNKIKLEIHKRASGNPYYIEEIIRLLIENDGLVRIAEGWQTTKMVDQVLDQIPESLRDIILARYDRLPKDLQQALQKATILGPSFALFLLQTQLDYSENKLDELLSQLEQKDFLALIEEGLDRVYAFKQTIVRDAIYHTILKRDRMVYHYQVAQTIKTFMFWLPGERNEILAYHLSQSMRPVEAIQFLITAGENALERFANKIATKHFRDALALFDQAEGLDPLDKPRSQIGLGKALKNAGSYDEAATSLQNAVDLLTSYQTEAAHVNGRTLNLLVDAYKEKADLRAREGKLEDGLQLLTEGIQNLGDAPETQYPGLWQKLQDRVAWIHFREGKLDLARKAAQQAILNANTWGNDDLITMASLNNTMGGISWMQSRFDEAIEYVQNSLEIYKEIDYHMGRAIASTNLGVLHFTSGKWVDAVRFFEQAEAIQLEHGYTPDRPTNLKNLGEVLMNLGYHKSARKHLTTSRQISRQLGLRINEAYAEIGLCRLSIFETDVIDAQKHLRNASRLIQDTGEEINDRKISLMLLEAQIRHEEGEVEQALKLSHDAVEAAQARGFLDEKSEAQRIYGKILTTSGRFDQAEEVLQQAIDLAKTQENPYKEGQARYEMGLLYMAKNQQKSGDSQDEMGDGWLQGARTQLNEAIVIFNRLGASYDLKKAVKAVAPLEKFN